VKGRWKKDEITNKAVKLHAATQGAMLFPSNLMAVGVCHWIL
jgi:hypothetical protein